jgi:hypothetical protein
MRLHDPTNFRRLIRRRCQYCGRDFFTDKQTGRPRLFCDKKCKDGEFRRLRYLTFKNVETPQKSEVSSKVSKVDLADRPSVLIGPNDPPVNILGGYKFPNAPAVDLSSLAESGETDMPMVASDWKPCAPTSPITDDLSIPAFLRRVRS